MSADAAGPPVTTLPPSALVDLVGAPVNPVLTIVAVQAEAGAGGAAGISYLVAEGRHPRTDTALDFIEEMRLVAVREGMAPADGTAIVIQTEDVPIDTPSVSWEARSDWAGVRLIPDLYYLMARGYEGFVPELAPWDRRDDQVIWRGSTTGRFWQRAEDLDGVPRYRLCRLARSLGPRADFGITDVVQSADEDQAALIRERLRQEGHLRAFIPFADLARYRYIVDMDGNSNSWNFMMKLRLGCCVLRVESGWRQWFSDRLTAWTHYVPIREDLSDLGEKVDWCFANPAESAAIAHRGRDFALAMTFEQEQRDAARTLFACREAATTV